MKWIFFRVVLCILIGITSGFPQTQQLLQITSPTTGTVVSPGQTVTISLAADPSVSNILVISSTPGGGFADGPDASGQFSLTIPADTPIGPCQVTALGASPKANDAVQSQPITLAVENPLPVVKLQTQSGSLHFDGPGVPMPIDVIATFSDGSVGNVSRSVNTNYKSQDTTVATVTDQGWVTGQAPGSTAIVVTVGSLQATVKVAVDQPTPPSTGDMLPPHTVAVVSPQPNSAGWNNSDVTVTFTAADEPGGSGVQAIHAILNGAQSARATFSGSTGSITISAEGTTNVTYYAVDAARNVEKFKGLTIRLDKTPPVILASRTPAPNVNGWNNTDVTVSFTCTDALSGIANGAPPPTVLSNDGANQQVTGTCQDVAGNVASATIAGINIDKTPPIIMGMPSECSLWPPNHKLEEVATINATDAPSGLATFSVNVSSNEPDGDQPEFIVSGGALQLQTIQLRAERSGSGSGRVYTIAAAASDLAGNVANSSATCTVPHDQSGK